MLNIDVEASKKRFMEKLEHGHYTVRRSQNTEDVYSDSKEKRDTDAVERFLSTDLADEIIRMK